MSGVPPQSLSLLQALAVVLPSLPLLEVLPAVSASAFLFFPRGHKGFAEGHQGMKS